MSKNSPEHRFPNLFGTKAQARPAEPMRAEDMRLLQYCMRQASKPRPALGVAPQRPEIRRPGAAPAGAARFPGAARAAR